MPFAWSTNDCITFATAAAAAMTGEDKASAYRGQYDDRKGAAAILKRLGQGTLLRTVNANFEPCKPGFARRGDLVWFKGSVGVSVGAEALFVGEERLARAEGVAVRAGLVAVPRGRWTKAWRVG